MSIASEKPSEPSNFLGVDSTRGIHVAVEHLLSVGAHRIGYADANPTAVGSSWARERFKAFLTTLDDHGLELRHQWLVGHDFKRIGHGGRRFDILPDEALRDRIDENVIRLLDLHDRPEAIVFALDKFAYTYYRFAGDYGVKIPEDVAIAGFNGTPVYGLDFDDFMLTTVGQDFLQLGRVALNTVMEIHTGKRELLGNTVLYPPELIVGNSTVVAHVSPDTATDSFRTDIVAGTIVSCCSP